MLRAAPDLGRLAEPLPGIAVDVNGEIYRSDPRTRAVIKRCCDGSESPLVCEHGVFARPAGLALDRRGLLYVADPAARRLVVVLPDDGSVAGVVVGKLKEPVDVAVTPEGTIYVADRAAGLIVRFNSRFERCGDFVPRGLTGLPETPAPIGVAIDADGAILVVDASHPRLLRFAPDGQPLADVTLAAAIQSLEGGGVALDALAKAYGRTAPRFLAGVCAPPHPSNDGGVRLAEVHRALRLLLIRLHQRFHACGTYLSAALDGGAPGIVWHKIEIDADLPPGTWLKIQTATADDPARFVDSDPRTSLIPATGGRTSCACCRRRVGRADRLCTRRPAAFGGCASCSSDGSATPSIRAVRIFYPRVSYLDLLPAYSARRRRARAPSTSRPVRACLHRRRRSLRTVLASAQPRCGALDVINWLACLIDSAFDPSWPLARRRAPEAAAMELIDVAEHPPDWRSSDPGVTPVILEGFSIGITPLVGVAGSCI